MDYKYSIFTVLGLAILIGCKSNIGHDLSIANSVDKNNIPNPAFVYCIERKGKLFFKQTPTGIYGECCLPNGIVMEEWAFYRKNHFMKKK